MTSAREIRLPAAHPDFRPRLQGSGRTVTHPGTAVRIGDDLFEVVSARPVGSEWIYGLEPWEEGQVSRVYIEWSPEGERAFLNRIRKDRIQSRKKALALSGQFLIGFLPGKTQERLAESLEFDPVRATLYSAILEILIGLPPAFLFFLQMWGAGDKFGPIVPPVVGFPAIAVAAEGLLRLVINVTSGDPVGCLLLSLIGLRFKREPKEDVMSDEFLPAGEILEVVSPTPKAWWEKAGGITFRGEPFVLVRSAAEGRSFKYAFKKGGAGFPETNPALERERNIASDRAYALAPLWGFLPKEDQEAVAFFGRYNARLYVRLSIAFNLLLSFSIVSLDMFRIAAEAFGSWTIIRFILALALFGESIIRLLRHLQTGEPSGSFVGVFIKPLYYLAVQAGQAGLEQSARRLEGPGSQGR